MQQAVCRWSSGVLRCAEGTGRRAADPEPLRHARARESAGGRPRGCKKGGKTIQGDRKLGAYLCDHDAIES